MNEMDEIIAALEMCQRDYLEQAANGDQAAEALEARKCVEQIDAATEQARKVQKNMDLIYGCFGEILDGAQKWVSGPHQGERSQINLRPKSNMAG